MDIQQLKIIEDWLKNLDESEITQKLKEFVSEHSTLVSDMERVKREGKLLFKAYCELERQIEELEAKSGDSDLESRILQHTVTELRKTLNIHKNTTKHWQREDMA